MRASMLSCAGVVATFCLAGSAHAGLQAFDFPLSGFQESPPVTTAAFGEATLIYDDSTQTFDLDLIVFGIELGDLMGVGPNSSPAHIHLAPPNMNGSIVIDIGFMSSFFQDDIAGGIRLIIDDGMFGGTQGGVTSDPNTNEAALYAGNLYVNVHTQSFPSGEVRGQIVPAPGAVALAGLAGIAGLSRRRR